MLVLSIFLLTKRFLGISMLFPKHRIFSYKKVRNIFFGQKLGKTEVTTLVGDQFLVCMQKSGDWSFFVPDGIYSIVRDGWVSSVCLSVCVCVSLLFFLRFTIG